MIHLLRRFEALEREQCALGGGRGQGDGCKVIVKFGRRFHLERSWQFQVLTHGNSQAVAQLRVVCRRAGQHFQQRGQGFQSGMLLHVGRCCELNESIRAAKICHVIGPGACRGWACLVGCVLLCHPPDAATLPVTPGIVQRDLVVADDLVVEVRDVEGVVGSQLEIHGAEPRVLAFQELGLLIGLGRGTGVGDVVVVDDGSDHVAQQHVVIPLRAPDAAADVDDACDAGGTVAVLAHHRAIAQAVVRLAEAGVVGAVKQLINGRAVAVRAVEIATRVPAQTERIHLAPGPDLHV